ncbi:MAG TPA: glycosyltransferase [Acidobacteriota bacterium]|nr:glycosyltransferase [Acidobacteriota bacterium]
MKMTLVVQRYGVDVVGGAERLCRGVAEGLAELHDVQVLTSCANSYRTWANHYPAGSEMLNGVCVRRFLTERERDMPRFNELSDRLFSGPATPADELAWIDAQGPFAPALVDYLRTTSADADVLLFFTYLYHPTVHGIHVAPERSVLVPTAHDERPFYFDTYEAVFTLPAGLIFNTDAEAELVRRRFPHARQPAQVIGVGVEDLDLLEAARTAVEPSAGAPVLLYAGRIEEGKGVAELIAHVRRFRHDTGQSPVLWLMGDVAMELPEEPWIKALGFVSHEEKRRRLAEATVLVAPSALESFGIVLLEANAAGTPVLANAASGAYVEHCQRGGGGLWYQDFGEFREALDLLLQDAALASSLARHGGQYARDHYSWEAIAAKYNHFLTELLER